MIAQKQLARKAGWFYLVMALSGPVGLIVAKTQILVAGNAALTVQNLTAHEMLFRAGIVSNFICQISFVFLVLALYRLFKEVHENMAKLMVALVIASVPMALAYELIQMAALHILGGAPYLRVFNPEQLNAGILFLLTLHEQGIALAGFFWGLWLFPFGYLVIKSGFIPKVLGVLLIVGCLGYLADSSVAILFPKYKAVTEMLVAPLSIGEISMVLWLLIAGVKVPRKVTAG